MSYMDSTLYPNSVGHLPAYIMKITCTLYCMPFHWFLRGPCNLCDLGTTMPLRKNPRTSSSWQSGPSSDSQCISFLVPGLAASIDGEGGSFVACFLSASRNRGGTRIYSRVSECMVRSKLMSLTGFALLGHQISQMRFYISKWSKYYYCVSSSKMKIFDFEKSKGCYILKQS